MVYDATKEYVVAALRYVNEHQNPGPTTELPTERWARPSPGQFVRQHDVEEVWSPMYGQFDDQIHGLAEYEQCLAALGGDGLIGPQIDVLVGTAIGAHRVEANAIPDGILTRLATEARGWRFHEALFEALYEEYKNALFAGSFAHVLVAPLPGLMSEALPIRLGEEAVIDTMTEEEALACVRTGMFQIDGRRLADYLYRLRVRASCDGDVTEGGRRASS